MLKESGWEKVIPHLQPENDARTVEMLITECANVIWKNVRIHKTLQREEGERLLDALWLLVDKGVITVEENRKYLREAFELSVEHCIAVYDALFIAQAKELNATLVTCDEKQGRIAEKLGVSTVVI
nr:type II toxin-antitoxin system VapC family toxin [Thermococcus sp. 9N3]